MLSLPKLQGLPSGGPCSWLTVRQGKQAAKREPRHSALGRFPNTNLDGGSKGVEAVATSS